MFIIELGANLNEAAKMCSGGFVICSLCRVSGVKNAVCYDKAAKIAFCEIHGDLGDSIGHDFEWYPRMLIATEEMHRGFDNGALKR